MLEEEKLKNNHSAKKVKEDIVIKHILNLSILLYQTEQI